MNISNNYDSYVDSSIIFENINNTHLVYIYYGIKNEEEFIIINSIDDRKTNIEFNINDLICDLNDTFLEVKCFNKKFNIIYNILDKNLNGEIYINLNNYTMFLK